VQKTDSDTQQRCSLSQQCVGGVHYLEAQRAEIRDRMAGGCSLRGAAILTNKGVWVGADKNVANHVAGVYTMHTHKYGTIQSAFWQNYITNAPLSL